MKTKTIAILSAAVGLALAAGASAYAFEDAKPATTTPPRSCFFASQISGWGSERDEKTVYLYVGAKDIYKAETFGRCMGIDDAISIGVQTRGGGSSICDGLDVDLLVRSSIGPQRCAITKLTKLTPDEVTAMKASKKKPKT